MHKVWLLLLMLLAPIPALAVATVPTPAPGAGTLIATPSPNPVQFNFQPNTTIYSNQVNTNFYKIYQDLNNLTTALNGNSSYICGACVSNITANGPITVTNTAATAGVGITYTFSCAVCAQVGVDNAFAVQQTVNGSVILPATGMANATTQHVGSNTLVMGSSDWNGSSAVASQGTIGYSNGTFTFSPANSNLSAGSATFTGGTLNGDLNLNPNGSGASKPSYRVNFLSTNSASTQVVSYINATTGSLNFNASPASGTDGFVFNSQPAGAGFQNNGTLEVELASTHAIRVPPAGTGGAYASVADIDIQGTTGTGTLHDYTMGVSSSDFWQLKRDGAALESCNSTACTFSGNIGTPLAANSGVCTDVNSFLSACTKHVKLEIGLGFATGTVATATVYPFQPMVAFTNGQITGIRAACGTADNGTTVFSLLKNGTSIGTLTLSTSAASSTSFAAVAIAAGDVLHGTITTAGTGQNCGFVAEGQQDAF